MAAGLGALQLAPAVFWAMTPRELKAALEGRFGDADGTETAPSRTELDALMQRFPDEEPDA